MQQSGTKGMIPGGKDRGKALNHDSPLDFSSAFISVPYYWHTLAQPAPMCTEYLSKASITLHATYVCTCIWFTEFLIYVLLGSFMIWCHSFIEGPKLMKFCIPLGAVIESNTVG